MVAVTCTCPGCGDATVLEVDQDHLRRWVGHVLIQVVFPHLSEQQRELLLSGYCATCWEKMWAYLADDEA